VPPISPAKTSMDLTTNETVQDYSISNILRSLFQLSEHLSREAQLFVGWVSGSVT
jgi:hypothetical protein